mgnify:CR=1 FL=1
MLEAVLLSMSLSHVSVINKAGDKNGRRWARLKEDDSVKPLTAILTLNTIAHTMGAAGVGAEVSRIWGDDQLTIASIILTLAVLFLSEIIPKTLGSAYWRFLSGPSGIVLSGMTKLLTPFFVPLLWFKRLLPKAETALVTRDELHALADIGEEEGELDEDEEAVILTPAILALVPVAADGANVSKSDAMSVFDNPVVFKEKNKSVEIAAICVATYAFIDCCVANASLASDEKSSSSKT